MLQQLCGVNGVLFYSSTIFEAAGELKLVLCVMETFARLEFLNFFNHLRQLFLYTD